MCEIRTIALYETWREYGGPEEGGWWYSVSRRIAIHSGPVDGATEYLAADFAREAEHFDKIHDEDHYVVDVTWDPLEKIEDPSYLTCGCDGYGTPPKVWPNPDLIAPESLPLRRPHYC